MPDPRGRLPLPAVRAPVVPARLQGVRLHSAAGRGARIRIGDGAHLRSHVVTSSASPSPSSSVSAGNSSQPSVSCRRITSRGTSIATELIAVAGFFFIRRHAGSPLRDMVRNSGDHACPPTAYDRVGPGSEQVGTGVEHATDGPPEQAGIWLAGLARAGTGNLVLYVRILGHNNRVQYKIACSCLFHPCQWSPFVVSLRPLYPAQILHLFQLFLCLDAGEPGVGQRDPGVYPLAFSCVPRLAGCHLPMCG